MRPLARVAVISLVIGLLLGALFVGFARETLTVLHAACLGLIWFTGIRATVLWARSRHRLPPVPAHHDPLRVALLYCTADDLKEETLLASIAQDVAVDVYLLDDSAGDDARAHCDAVAMRIGARVLRRDARTGAKAGNLNHALGMLAAGTDAVVILDNDTLLPPDFVRRTTAVLASDPKIACVQAMPEDGGPSWFARFFGPLVGTHARINHATRARIGFALFGGRGALLSLSALREVGGFPLAVAEDLAVSVRLREAGWRIVHRSDIEFQEDFPIDYAAFRVQQGKAAEGATEFLLSSRSAALPRRERWDVALETALLPMGALAGLSALALGTTLALQGSRTPVPLMVITAVLALAPLLPEAIRRIRDRRPLSAMLFLAATPMLYASVSLVIVRHAARVARGARARFIVTPKTATRPGLVRTLTALRAEFAWALGAMTVMTLLGMPLLGVPFLVPALAATALLLLGARSHIPLITPAAYSRSRTA